MSYQNNGSGAAVLEENVMNNPVMMYDPDGRVSQEWLNGIYNMSRPGKTTYSQFSSNGMSAWANYESLPFGEASRLYSWIDRGGSGYYTYWSGGDSDFTAFFQGGKLNFGGDFGNYNLVRVYNNVPEIRQSYHNFNPYIPDNTPDWYGPGGKVNWFIGAAGTGVDIFAQRFYIGTARSNAPVRFLGRNYYGNGRTFIKAAPIAGAIGRFSFGLAVAMDVRGTINYYNDPTSPNSVNPGKATVNTAFGALGVWGGVAGGVGSLFYFGIDAFYPGGWDGAMIDTERRQAVFDEIINQNSGMAPQYIFPYGSQKF